jgi:hypothetical protein
MSAQAGGYPPKVIWLVWLQGWDNAPQVVHACRRSWESSNPGWVVNCLDLRSLPHFIPADIVEDILGTHKEPEALSDQIRLELLHRYGGVWADGTAMCAKPLDDWLAPAMPNGFFAFARPGPDRMVSTWFLAAEKGSYIAEQWRNASWTYWEERAARHDYFWLHQLFASVYEADPVFRDLWERTPQISAVHWFHFGPNSADLYAPPPGDIDQMLVTPPAPVFKLTHKFDTDPDEASLFAHLCSRACSMPPSHRPVIRRLLVGWFGSFSGHGTIGDLRSLEAVVSHLVGRGHTVFHATADPVSISGATKVDWRQVSPHACDAVIFVCGPILLNHPETTAFFAHFAAVKLAGVGVSLLPEGHQNYVNPFTVVFARQGGSDVFGDVAICAPQSRRAAPFKQAGEEAVIGLALRGEQHEYGVDLCLWREANLIFTAFIDLVSQYRPVRVVEIENHLLRSRRTPEAIEQQYAECDLVLTTRFHGAVTALRQNVPFIALDQIRSGAKVLPLLSGLGWDAVYEVETVNTLDIMRTGLNLLQDRSRSQLVSSRCRHVHEGNRTLAHLDQWLEELDRP